VLGDTLALVPLRPQLTPHDLCRRPTQTTIVRRRRVTGCAAAAATIAVAVVDYYVLLLLLFFDSVYALIFMRVRRISKTGCYLHHVCPSAWNNWAPTGRIFMVSYVIIFRKCLKTVRDSLKSDKNNGYFT
jgi:hypothetical protein